MKIVGYQLENSTAKKLKPAYLLSGDDAFLCYDALELIHEIAIEHGFTEKIKWKSQEDADNSSLTNLLFSQPLFESKELIDLDFGDKLPTATQQSILQKALQYQDTKKIIVMRCKKLDEKTQKTQWFHHLDQVGLIIAIWPLNYEQLKIFITARAKKYRMTIDINAITLLANFSEGNVSVAAQTLEKLYLLDQHHITEPLIAELMTYDNTYSVFDLCDALITNDNARMLRMIENLQETGAELTLVLWALTREIRLLIDCLTEKNHGGDLQAIFKKQRVVKKKQDIIRSHLQYHSLSRCYHWLQHAFIIDQKIKRFSIADAWRELHIFCLRAS